MNYLIVTFLAALSLPLRAHVTNAPSLIAKLDKIYQRLEKLTIPTTSAIDGDDEEEVLLAMQAWGKLDEKQLSEVARDLQKMRRDAEERMDRSDDYMDEDEEYAEDYHNDGKEDEDDDLKIRGDGGDLFMEEPEASSISPLRPGVTPIAITRDDGFRRVVSAVGSIAATNERPRILDDSGLSAIDRKTLRTAAYANIGRAVRASNCLVPQPRWLSVRQMAPSSDTMYMPPCVQLHRCAPDSGCCKSEAEVCAPVEGQHVVVPFYLHKADGNNSVARMLFFNHTACTCVARDTLSAVHVSPPFPKHVEERQNDWRQTSVVSLEERQNDWRQTPVVTVTQAPTVEPTVADVTAPPMMRRCTCPKYFQASTAGGACECSCEWKDLSRRRECLYFSRGKEHLGLSDRVCIEHKDCTLPTCDYGAYDRRAGKCPTRKFRRLRYHIRRHDKTVV